MSRLPRPLQLFLRLALVALAYGLTARLSLNLALVHGQVTPIWPPTGIALVAFLLLGRSIWPAVYLAALVVNLPIGPSPLGAAFIAAGNTLAPLAAAEMLRRLGFHRSLDRLRDAMALIFLGGLLGMVISATVGSTVLLVGGAISAPQFWSTWAVWWVGDAMGVLLVAPFLLSVLELTSPPLLSLRQDLELVGLVAVTGLLTFVLFQNHLRLEYLVLPLIMASAWRFRLRGAAPAALVASGVAIISAVHGTGPFGQMTLLQKMITLQAFNVSLALGSFVLASFVESREREERMVRLYAIAEQANQAKTRFLHLAAHELRTPISVVTGYLSMLSDGSLGEPPAHWQRPLGILSEKTKELNALVAQLLEASRLQSAEIPRTVSRLDLREAAETAVGRARARADLIGAQLDLALPEAPVLVAGDRDQLARILDNLINNALTYNVNAPRLSISVGLEGQSAAIRVRDNGVGIAEADRERVFEQFQRVGEPAFNHVPGTGLGLFISRQLATANGGSLSIERSAVGEGTVFLLSLPALAPAESHPLPLVQTAPAAESADDARRLVKVPGR